MSAKAQQLFTFLWMLFFFGYVQAQAVATYDVVIIGGGASGISAGITAGRLGVKTLIIEEGPWLGGMITSAGVSAFDGNHRIAGGIFAEFRDSLYQYYGGPAAVETGWVSNTLFEPKTGKRIFENMARRIASLKILYNTALNEIYYKDQVWHLQAMNADAKVNVTAKVVIDATELGDVVHKLGLPADIGMDSGILSNEPFAPDNANDIVQDLTWVAILQEFPEGTQHLLPKPQGYNPEMFTCACDTRDPSTSGSPLIDCRKMLEYGRLPNGKYMINWPNCGNDIYLNVVSMNREERMIELQKAKQRTLDFVYYLQHDLGFTKLGLAEDEFPNEDGLALIPYHRESRRIKGKTRLKVQHILKPFDHAEAFYRTGIAVGDYPIDHHHKQNPSSPAIDFINIKAPSYNIPLGSLLPDSDIPLIVAEKSISVSNIVNGTTRLQPVVLGIGQAAGTLAAQAAEMNLEPSAVSVRLVQQSLLNQGAYIMPYIDVAVSDPDFQSIQRIGATGWLRGHGIPYKWTNQTWFYPDSLCISDELFFDGMEGKMVNLSDKVGEKEYVTPVGLLKWIPAFENQVNESEILSKLITHFPQTRWTSGTPMTRRQVALIIDYFWAPFSKEIDINGNLKKSKNEKR